MLTLAVEAVTPAYSGFTVTCDHMATQDKLYAIRNGAIPIFSAGSQVAAVLPTSMLYLKLVDVPYLSLAGQTITPQKVMEFIQRSPAASSVVLTAPLWVVHNSAASNMATVYLNIADTVSGARAKEVISKPLQMGGKVVYIRAAKANPGMVLCQCCWKWGHPSSACCALQVKCPLCMGPHGREHHCLVAAKGMQRQLPLSPLSLKVCHALIPPAASIVGRTTPLTVANATSGAIALTRIGSRQGTLR